MHVPSDDDDAPVRVAEAAQKLVGLPCWHVSAGGAAGSSFSLALGAKVPRAVPLRNEAQPVDYRRFEGEATLLVWCSWRLETESDAVASSDVPGEKAARELAVLIGQRVLEAKVRGRACDLILRFDRHRLCVFCDHVPGEPSFDGNWQLEHRPAITAVGPGFRVEQEASKP